MFWMTISIEISNTSKMKPLQTLSGTFLISYPSIFLLFAGTIHLIYLNFLFVIIVRDVLFEYKKFLVLWGYVPSQYEFFSFFKFYVSGFSVIWQTDLRYRWRVIWKQKSVGASNLPLNSYLLILFFDFHKPINAYLLCPILMRKIRPYVLKPTDFCTDCAQNWFEIEV